MHAHWQGGPTVPGGCGEALGVGSSKVCCACRVHAAIVTKLNNMIPAPKGCLVLLVLLCWEPASTKIETQILIVQIAQPVHAGCGEPECQEGSSAIYQPATST